MTVPAELEPGAVWRWPLTQNQPWHLRLLMRAVARLALAQVTQVVNWRRLLPECDPFILVANHGSRREAVYLSALCLLVRSGKPVRFLGDWNFRLIPGVGFFYDHSGTILVTSKPARPRVLDRLRPRFAKRGPPFEQARATLLAGGSVGIFPEGTVNRSNTHLLRGRYGAARLSLELGVPLLPLGLRFLGPPRPAGRADSRLPLRIEVGSPIPPPAATTSPSAAQVREWHREMMTAIASRCGKIWTGKHAVIKDPHGNPAPTAVAGGSVTPEEAPDVEEDKRHAGRRHGGAGAGARGLALDLPGREGLGRSGRDAVPGRGSG